MLALASFNQNVAAKSQASGKKPNICIIWGDDIGQSNVSAYSMGLMGYRTPNIDRVAKEGMIFTDYYAEQSCTAGRASFITGQHGLRTGLTKVGLPGATLGLRKEDPTIAELLKPLGYATGQFGKNHLGRPQRVSAHGAWLRRVLWKPVPPERRGRAGAPRLSQGSRRSAPNTVRAACWIARPRIRDDATVDPRFGKVGKQIIKDTGPLTKKRMETIDDDNGRPRRRLHPARGKSRQAIFRVGQFHPHALPHACQARERWSVRPLDERIHRRHDRSRQERRHRAQSAGRCGRCRQYVRHVLNRQRPAHEYLARRRDDAVPQREKLQLGGRVPRAVHGPLAGTNPRRQRLERNRRPPRLAAHAVGDRGRSRRQREAAQWLQDRRHHLQGSHRRLQPGSVSDRPDGQDPSRVVHLLQ